MQRWLHAAESQVGLTPAGGADEITGGDHISIMAEGGAANKHPRCRATSGYLDAATNRASSKGGHMFSLRQVVRAASALAAAASLAGVATAAQAQDKGPIRIGFLPPITDRKSVV